MADFVLLALATPFAIWAAWTDLTTMHIQNEQSTFAALAFVLVMPFFLPLDDFGLRIAIAGWILIIGFFMNVVGMVGGGDVKFATAMVPYALPQDLKYLLTIYLASLLICFFLHRLTLLILRRQNVELGWKSFDAGGKFPMGFPMAVAILTYLIGKAAGIGPL